MNAWNGKTEDGVYGLVLEEQVQRELIRVCTKSGELETGGILIGYYTDDLSTAVVNEVSSPPTDSVRGFSSFSRGVVGLSRLLKRRWNSANRTYYLGEWHYHPVMQIKPSCIDMAQMLAIQADSKYYCNEPILLIVGKMHEEELRARAFVFPDQLGSKEFILKSGEYR